MRVYISGPISPMPSIEAARELFANGAAYLARFGHEPVNPFDVEPWPDCACGSTDRTGAGSGHQWACYLRGDIAALLGCDAIFMLPGWEGSHGARLELSVAAAVGLRVLMTANEIGVAATAATD